MIRPPGIADFGPGQALRSLEASGVHYVVIGALAAIAAGALTI